MDIFTCKDVDGRVVEIDYPVLEAGLRDRGFQLFGMTLPEMAEFRRQYRLRGGKFPITTERIIEIFEEIE